VSCVPNLIIIINIDTRIVHWGRKSRSARLNRVILKQRMLLAKLDSLCKETKQRVAFRFQLLPLMVIDCSIMSIAVVVSKARITRVLRLGLGFWSFVDWEVMLALPAGRESDGLRIQRKGCPLLTNPLASS
jgi:hypothetical protein